MKKTLLLSAVVLITASAAFANSITVMVSSFMFSPKNINAFVGDTIIWVWVNGSHTTTSTKVPNGTATWDSPINKNNKTFSYVLAKKGTYKFKCTPHASQMTGKIVVTVPLAAGVSGVSVELTESAKALIKWSVKKETDIAYYSVQRSTDAENFTEIARIKPAAGTAAAPQAHNYTDNGTGSTEKYIYYQLETVDKKGNVELSPIKMFACKIPTSKLIRSLSPNPVAKDGHLMVQFNADKEGSMLMQLYSENGIFIKQAEMTAYRGLNNGHFHLGDVKPGSYYVVCTMDNLKEKHTIIIK